MRDSFPDYAVQLRSAVEDYRGKRERSVRRAGDLFDFFARLFADPRVPRYARATVNAVLAYFVVPNDVLPEEEVGAFGLLDDLYVAAHAFRQLRRDVPPEVLLEAWHGEEDLDTVMAEAHADSRAELGKRCREVLRMAGLA
ncbi:MAG: DUF1232 domain-containing protein [Deltaproteobacteria bacterium]|nr:DUF1232 domain-containing protein [Deltaproteobacteria bacterium]